VKRRRVLVLFPTAWDEAQFAALPSAVQARYELVYDSPADDEVRWDFDVLAYLDARERQWRGRLDGVFSSSDYPGAIAAAALAYALGLRGAPPAAVLRAGHKFYAREAQRTVVPELVPRYRLFDPADERTWPPESDFPCFVKPVKASFSLFARHIADRTALATFAADPALAEFRTYYAALFERLAARYARFEHGAHLFLAEEVLRGEQVTVESWVRAGTSGCLGIVDTSFHPGTQSFASFDYPSRVAPALHARLASAARTVALALGLDHTLFNVELFHDPVSERIGLIEINPRLCGQFGDLYAKVDGVSGFEFALALACGEDLPAPRAPGAFAAAASIPLRLFRSAYVARAPDANTRRALELAYPSTLLWSDVGLGDELRVDPTVEDGVSVRYGVVNFGGESRELLQRARPDIEARAGFEFAPLDDRR
jgi:biotin carboxylase